ncbi:MAG: DUF4167 domain-containing protein [Citromicrobium sp.]|nr:MAG: DUF4167 domain-containing protein [Citromicrobium sp.]
MNNNNRNNNNRRRGRGNNRQQGGGGQLNRIDSRSRGNAPQMLDKYKKLAQDAAHNGDRVQAEYYLQFADHYFRVIADNKARQDEQRGRRDDGRDGQRERGERDFARDERDDNRYENRFDGGYDQSDGEDEGEARGASRRQREQAEDQARTPRRRERPVASTGEQDEAESGEDAGNPFLRDEPRSRAAAPRTRRPRAAAAEDNAPAFDAAILPPAIQTGMAPDEDGDADGDDMPAPRAAPRRRRKLTVDEQAADTGEVGHGDEGDDAPLSAVG